jgi:hypothetical protein
MKKQILNYLIIILFLASSPSGFAMKHELDESKAEHIYLRHLTEVLPSPVMIVGGVDVRFRPTLHWSIVGVEVQIALLTIDQDGDQKNPYSLESGNNKYGILERFDILAPFVIGGECWDIFTFGHHMVNDNYYLTSTTTII